MKYSTSQTKHSGVDYQQGFTLLELVLVLFLMGLMASAGLLLTENVQDQSKFDETHQRIEVIRQAIIGDLTRTVNGGPELSGFVADVGRLPVCIRELIELGDELSPGVYRSPCDLDPHDTAFDLTLWQSDPVTGVGAGWRGPYLQASMESDGRRRFRDGYANGDNLDDIDDGWKWSLATGTSDVDQLDLSIPASAVAASHVHLNSDGFSVADPADNVPVNGNQFLIADDWLYPNGISSQALIPVKFRIDNSLSSTSFTVNPTLTRPGVNSSFLTMPLSATPVTLTPSNTTILTESIVFEQPLPMGRYLFRLQCSVSCVPESYLLTVLPRQTLAPLEFQIIP